MPFWQSNGWLSLVTLGTTIVPPRVVPRIFTYIKKLIRYPKTRSRFWVNAQCSFLVTRKPLNVRMGKGKGAKVRFYTKIGHATPLAAVSSLRAGFKKKLTRFVSIRLGRKVVILEPTWQKAKVEWAQRHRTQIDFLRTRASEVKNLLTFIRKPSTKIFFGKLFRAAWRRPRLRWRLRWPLLPRVSARLKPRRKKWGSGVKSSAPIWAGLASVMAGVRRIKTKITPAMVAKKRLRGQLRKFFLDSRSSFYRPKRLAFLKRLLSIKNSVLCKSLKFKILKRRRGFSSGSFFVVPLSSSLRPMLSIWSRLGLSLSERGASPLLNLKVPSLSTLVKSVSILEKGALLVYGATRFSTLKEKVFVQGSLSLLKASDSKEGPASGDEGGLVLTYIVEDGFLELWPNVNLRPLALTFVALNPIGGAA